MDSDTAAVWCSRWSGSADEFTRVDVEGDGRLDPEAGYDAIPHLVQRRAGVAALNGQGVAFPLDRHYEPGSAIVPAGAGGEQPRTLLELIEKIL